MQHHSDIDEDINEIVEQDLQVRELGLEVTEHLLTTCQSALDCLYLLNSIQRIRNSVWESPDIQRTARLQQRIEETIETARLVAEGLGLEEAEIETALTVGLEVEAVFQNS